MVKKVFQLRLNKLVTLGISAAGLLRKEIIVGFVPSKIRASQSPVRYESMAVPDTRVCAEIRRVLKKTNIFSFEIFFGRNFFLG